MPRWAPKRITRDLSPFLVSQPKGAVQLSNRNTRCNRGCNIGAAMPGDLGADADAQADNQPPYARIPAPDGAVGARGGSALDHAHRRGSRRVPRDCRHGGFRGDHAVGHADHSQTRMRFAPTLPTE